MKKFITQLLLFILPLLIISIVLEGLLRNIPNDYEYKKDFLENNVKDIEKLFLGSSHAYYGINPIYIKGNAFNASHISQTIDLDYELLKKYEPKFHKLKYIVIPIDYFTMFSRLSTGLEYWRVKNYNLYYDLNLSTSLSDNSELLSVNLKSNLKRIYRYYIKHNSYITCNKLGFGFKFSKQNDLIKSGKTAALRHTKRDLSNLNESIGILQKIINYANQHNIKIIFYTSPANKTYISNLNKHQLELTINTINKLVKRNKNVYYFNLLANNNFQDEDYRDADHLNPKGAEKLTKLLDKIIQNEE